MGTLAVLFRMGGARGAGGVRKDHADSRDPGSSPEDLSALGGKHTRPTNLDSNLVGGRVRRKGSRLPLQSAVSKADRRYTSNRPGARLAPVRIRDSPWALSGKS